MHPCSLAEDDEIYADPADVVMRLDSFISETAKRVLADGAYKLSVATVCESNRTYVRIGDAEIAFPDSTASLPPSSGAVLAPVLYLVSPTRHTDVARRPSGTRDIRSSQYRDLVHERWLPY